MYMLFKAHLHGNKINLGMDMHVDILGQEIWRGHSLATVQAAMNHETRPDVPWTIGRTFSARSHMSVGV